ncbi:MAG TPA: class I SAM-dependent methyltransferase [Hyphomicrobiaceae bacterium]|nr:class I SAM-dependent methyltransferase [Hyphomicrobiaceae bacterium]
MTTPSSMVDYYEARAPQYEAIYDRPERQAELRFLRGWLAREAHGLTLLEVACGSGYWTGVAATTAKAILATDCNPSPLELARSKNLGPHVTYARADAFALPTRDGLFEGGMAHFWWSHVSLADQQRFLMHFASKLRKRAKLLMIDNTFAAGSTPIARRDALGNTYQRRRLASGDDYEILKNFPTGEELRRSLEGSCESATVLELEHYWAVSAVLR